MNLKKFMVLVLSALLVFGIGLMVSCAGWEVETPVEETPTQIIEDVTAQEAFTMIQNNQNNPDFVIIDVRTPEEFAEGHIENAININFRAENFRDEIDKLDKSKTHLVYCRSGNRSQSATDMMTELNFTKIYHMTGGIIEWEAEGLPTVK